MDNSVKFSTKISYVWKANHFFLFSMGLGIIQLNLGALDYGMVLHKYCNLIPASLIALKIENFSKRFWRWHSKLSRLWCELWSREDIMKKHRMLVQSLSLYTDPVCLPHSYKCSISQIIMCLIFWFLSLWYRYWNSIIYFFISLYLSCYTHRDPQ